MMYGALAMPHTSSYAFYPICDHIRKVGQRAVASKSLGDDTQTWRADVSPAKTVVDGKRMSICCLEAHFSNQAQFIL